MELSTFTSSVNSSISNWNENPIRLYTEYPFSLVHECLGAVGFLSNLFVLFILLVFRPPHYQQTSTDFFIICQTIVNALAAFFVLTQTLFEKVGGDILVMGSFVDELLCRVWLKKLLQWSFLVSSTYSVLALTVDRFIAVVYPIFYQTKFSTGSFVSKLICILFILFAMSYVWIYILPTSGVLQDGRCHLYELWPNPTLKRFVGFLTLFVQFFIPLFVIIICYSAMILSLHKRVAPSQIKGESIVKENLSSGTLELSNSNSTDKVWTTSDEKLQRADDVNNGNVDTAIKTSNLTFKSRMRKKSTTRNSLDNAKVSILKTSALLAATFVACWSCNQVILISFTIY